MRSTSHAPWRSQLSPYLDGELTPEEARRVGDHIKECPDCRERLNQMASISASFRGLEREPMPADLREALVQQGRRPGRISAAERRWAFSLGYPWAIASLASAALLLVVVVMIAQQGEGTRLGPPIETPPVSPSLDRTAPSKPAEEKEDDFPTAGRLEDLSALAPSQGKDADSPAPPARQPRRAFEADGRAARPGKAQRDDEARPSKPQALGAAEEPPGSQGAVVPRSEPPEKRIVREILPGEVLEGQKEAAKRSPGPASAARYRADLLLREPDLLWLGPMEPVLSEAGAARAEQAASSSGMTSSAPRDDSVDHLVAENDVRGDRRAAAAPAPALQDTPMRSPRADPEIANAARTLAERRGPEIRLNFLVTVAPNGRVVSAEILGLRAAPPEVLRAITQLLMDSSFPPLHHRISSNVAVEVRIPARP